MDNYNYGFNIADLPNEIIEKILYYLSPLDRLNIGATCHRWFDVTEMTIFKRDLKLSFISVNFDDNIIPLSDFKTPNRCYPCITFEQVDFGDADNFLLNFGEFVEEIIFKSCDIKEKKLLSILSYLPNLISLTIQSCSELFMIAKFFNNDRDVLSICDNLSNIKKLSLSHNRYLSDRLFNRLATMMPKLEEIVLSECHISFHRGLYGKYYPLANRNKQEPSESVLTFSQIFQVIELNAITIRHLDFSRTLIDGDALTLLANVNNLVIESLNLMYCEQITNVGLINLVKGQQNIIHLNLSHSMRVTDLSLIEICNNLKKLKTLKIKNCRAITDLGVIAVAQLDALEVLDMSAIESITNKGIIEGIAKKLNLVLKELYISALTIDEIAIIKIGENLLNLNILDLMYLYALRDLGLKIIFKNLINLKILNLNDCQLISDLSMMGLNKKNNEMCKTGNNSSESYDDEMDKAYLNDLRRMGIGPISANMNQMKISLGSKAEHEILTDAKRKKVMLTLYENTTEVNNNFTINRLKGLKILKLTNCNKITDLSLKYCFKFTELRELCLKKCQQITITGIKELVKNCPALEILDLTECYNINDKSIELITIYLGRLTHLYLDRCLQLTDFSLDYIVINCMNLKLLSICGCRGMSNEPNLRLTTVKTLRTILFSGYDSDNYDFKNSPKPPPLPTR